MPRVHACQKNFGKPVEWGLVKQYPVRVGEPLVLVEAAPGRGAFHCRRSWTQTLAPAVNPAPRWRLGAPVAAGRPAEAGEAGGHERQPVAAGRPGEADRLRWDPVHA